MYWSTCGIGLMYWLHQSNTTSRLLFQSAYYWLLFQSAWTPELYQYTKLRSYILPLLTTVADINSTRELIIIMNRLPEDSHCLHSRTYKSHEETNPPPKLLKGCCFGLYCFQNHLCFLQPKHPKTENFFWEQQWGCSIPPAGTLFSQLA